MRQKTWDKYEVALLLNYCLKVEEGLMSRRDAVAYVSETLRKRATKQGIKIDSVFRNINGISMQMSSIRNCYFGKENGLTVSKLFREIVTLYKENRKAFDQIMQESFEEIDSSVKVASYSTNIKKLIVKYYPYGFRLGSPIELKRIRNFAEKNDISLPDSDEELALEIATVGIQFDGRMYVINEETRLGIASLSDRAFHEGVKVIFLDRLMEIHDEWLSEHHIATVDMLKKLLQWVRPQYYYGKNIITPGEELTEQDAIVKEILRVSEGQSFVKTEDLIEKLPYITQDKIARSLSINPEFIRICDDKYFLMNKFVISEEDAKAITEYATHECELKGYASITNLPLDNILEENFELPETAVYVAVYSTVLKDQFYLNGKILTKEENGVDIYSLLKAYCNEKSYCTASELMEKAKELTGSFNKRASMTALYDTLVRIGVNEFISEDQIHFDVNAIDALLQHMIGARFAPIKSVSTFALFPSCGIRWNHYVLESFCYRFSDKYKLIVLNFNDQNVGLIVSKDLTLRYEDMLCEALAASKKELTPEAAGRYFFDNGFMAKRSFVKLAEIVERAKKIREER